jgi:hypothetical protein
MACYRDAHRTSLPLCSSVYANDPISGSIWTWFSCRSRRRRDTRYQFVCRTWNLATRYGRDRPSRLFVATCITFGAALKSVISGVFAGSVLVSRGARAFFENWLMSTCCPLFPILPPRKISFADLNMVHQTLSNILLSALTKRLNVCSVTRRSYNMSYLVIFLIKILVSVSVKVS